jgi:hypothetical protein
MNPLQAYPTLLLFPPFQNGHWFFLSTHCKRFTHLRHKFNCIICSAGSIRRPQVNPATVVNATMTPTTVPLAATSSNSEQIPEAPSQTSIANVTGPPESIASQSAPTALLSSDNGPDNSVSSKKVVKMRPGPRKNGR